MEFLKNIILFLILLSLIVSIHELGHLLAAKFFGVYCQEYAIGMGPKIWSHKGKETEFSIRAFPLGGFVAMAGEEDDHLETHVDTADIPYERTLKGIAKWKQVIIMLAGIFMNMVLAVVIYSLIILGNGQYAISSKPVITGIVEGSPAEKAGLQAGDLVDTIAFDNNMSMKPETYVELISFTSIYDGNGPWHMTVIRDGEKVLIDATPEYSAEEERYLVGISFGQAAYEVVDVNILNCWKYGFEYAFFILRMTWSGLLSIFRSRDISSLSGPVGIYNNVAEVATLGFDYYLQLIAMISINVALVNALPLPIFDGGRVFLLLIEMIIRRPLSEKAQSIIMSASLFLLLFLFMLITFNDVSKLIGG